MCLRRTIKGSNDLDIFASRILPSCQGLVTYLSGFGKKQMAKAGSLDAINPIVWNSDWNVNSQAVGDGRAALTYLAPYAFKAAI